MITMAACWGLNNLFLHASMIHLSNFKNFFSLIQCFFFDTYIESTYISCTRNIFCNIITINYLHGQSFNLYENREGESNSSFISGHSNGLTFLAYFSLVGLLPGTYLEGVWSKLIISDAGIPFHFTFWSISWRSTIHFPSLMTRVFLLFQL